MKIIIVLLMSILTFLAAFGQVAIIDDPDGWTNLRKDADGSSNVVHRLLDSEVFWYDWEALSNQQEWIKIFITRNPYTLGQNPYDCFEGYIHSSRIKPLDSLTIYNGSDFQISYTIADFDSTNRIIEKSGKWPISIDDRPIWGTDGTYPNNQIDSIKVRFGKERIQIHRVFYSDLFGIDNSFEVYKNNDTYMVHQWNGDGAGAYEIVWVFDKNGLKQRLVGTMF
ncbi:MAG: hypothetical protein ABR574_11385 [Cryomorphaceae bacterium]